MSGLTALGRQIAKVRALGSLAIAAARDAAPRLEAVARASAASGTTPEGKAWKARQSGGNGPLLKNAPAAITAAVGIAVVVLIVRGHHFFHTTGRGSPLRKIIPLPGDPLPRPYVDAIRGASVEAFRKAVR